MTEYEVIDALISLRTEIANHSMNFVTVMFGYVVAAYLVGKKLTCGMSDTPKLNFHVKVNAEVHIRCFQKYSGFLSRLCRVSYNPMRISVLAGVRGG